MLNICPLYISCGTAWPLWTDEEVPEDVLLLATINVYASYYKTGDPSYKCKTVTYQAEVIRCSLDTDYDLIYRYIGNYVGTCNMAFCGMT